METSRLKKITKIILWFLAIVGALYCADMINRCYGAERIGGNAERLKENDLCRVTCRIYNNNTAGSGAIFHEDGDGNLYVLTNYHVAGRNNCKLHFVVNGSIERIDALNVWQGYNETSSLDAVVLKIPAESVKYISDKLGFVPFWNSKENQFFFGEEEMITAGAPKAQWPKLLEGRIRFNGQETAEFKPTPYGGQSGSAIFIERNNKYYIGALLTWRQAEEGNEGYGGLAQPIGRVINAMNGNVAETDCPLPSFYIECPTNVKKEDCIYIGKEKRPVIPCSASSTYIEFWECANCSYCEQAKQSWLPEFEKKTKVVVLNASGKNADYAKKIGVSTFPTIRVINNGVQYSLYTGFAEANYNSVMFDLAKLIPVYTQEPEAETIAPDAEQTPDAETENGVDCIDESCKLFGGQCQPKAEQPMTEQNKNFSSGVLPFSLPFSDDETTPNQNEKNDRGGIIERIAPNIAPKIAPKSESPKISPIEKGKLFGGLKNKIDKSIKGKIEQMTFGIFWVCFFACTLALATYKMTVQIAKCLWWGIKKVFETIAGKFAVCVYNLADKVADKVAETVKQTKTKTTDKQ